jgi:hypothetical protein
MARAAGAPTVHGHRPAPVRLASQRIGQAAGAGTRNDPADRRPTRRTRTPNTDTVRAPSRARVSCAASLTHCSMAAKDFAPATTAEQVRPASRNSRSRRPACPTLARPT